MSARDESGDKSKPETVFISVPMREDCPSAFVELLRASLEQKKGLTFFLNGQALPGVVTACAGDGTVELRSREFSRILVRLRDVGAIALS